MVLPRLRYTHFLTIYNNTNSIFDGSVALSMTPASIQPSSAFHLECVASDTTDITGLKVTGLVDGISTTENMTLDPDVVKYSENEFTSITALQSKSFDTGTTLIVNAVDNAYQPIYWESESEPYKCTFSTVDGMAAGIQSEPIGLRTVLRHYVRLPLSAPVEKNMEFSISPIGLPSRMTNPYTGIRYVPVTDFDVVCLPPKYLPIERAFQCSEKTES